MSSPLCSVYALTFILLLCPREQLQSIVMSMSVCLCVCPRGYLQNNMRYLNQSFVHVAYVCSSVLLWHVDDRPHRLSAGRGDGSAQRGRSVIYDCLVLYVNIYLLSVT